MANETYKPIRLTLMAASREFKISRTPLKTKLADTPSGDDNCYSVKQIVDAVYDSSRDLRDKEILERTEYWRLKNEVTRCNLLDKADVEKALAQVVITAKQLLLASCVPKQAAIDFLNELSRTTVVVRDVAAKQRRRLGSVGAASRKSEAQKPGDEDE